MKILFLIPSLCATDGGTAKTVPALAAAFGRMGWSVDLVTTDVQGSANVVMSLQGWIGQAGFRLRYFARLGRMDYKPSLALFAWLWNHVGEYDAVHLNSNFNFPVLAGALVCRLRRVPYLLSPHGMLEPWALDYKAWKKRAYYLGIERPFVLHGAVAIQALNGNEAANIKALCLGSTVVTLSNGIDPHEAEDIATVDREVFLKRFPVARGKTLLLFLHRIDPKKGLDLLARAFAVIHTRFPETHLILAGPDNVNFSETAQGFFERAGCGGSEAITFTGMLEGSLKRGALAAATIFVAPSYSEGFSMSVLETMAVGLPGVITTGCNFPEAALARVVRETAINSDALAVALHDLLANPVAAAAEGKRARAFVLAHYTWDQIALREIASFHDLLGERRKNHSVP